jgi:hypothetical protein
MLSISDYHPFMSSDASQFPPSRPLSCAPSLPKPGQIWSLCKTLRSPLSQDGIDPASLYSIPAQQFLQGEFPAHYIMVIRELESEIEPEEAWQTVSVMVLSEQTEYLSDVDVLIPASLSGLDKDLLAETWHVLPMLGCNLQQPLGARLSRAVYDGLMTLGDRDQGLAIAPPNIEALGLGIAPPLTHQQPDIKAFHRQEIAWSDVLIIPFAAYQTYVRSLQWADVVLAKTLQVEQELQALKVTPLRAIAASRMVRLSHWLRQEFEPGWLAIESLAQVRISHLGAVPSRQVIENADPLEDNPNEISALVDVLRSSQDDETLWAAVERMWQVDPDNSANSAAGVRRVRFITLTGGRTVALVVSVIQRVDQRIGVMLRVYPTGEERYVPEDLKLFLFDDVRQGYEVLARQNDLYIQLKFNGHRGEFFRVQVVLEATSIVEDFMM